MENILWYKNEANTFEEALPIGNGKLGAMVYGKCGEEKLSLNYDELWSGKPGRHTRKGAYEAYKKAQKLILEGDVAGAEKYIESGISGDWTNMYMPLGNLYISGLGNGENYRRELDLRTGVVTVSYENAKRTYFASYDSQAIVLRIEGESDFEIRLDSQLKYDITSQNDKYILTGECPTYILNDAQSPTGEAVWGYMGEGVHFATVVNVRSDGAVSYSDTIKVSGATDTVITLAVKSSFIDAVTPPTAEYFESCIALSDAVGEYSEVFDNHVKYFSENYDKVKLSLTDKENGEDTLSRLRKNSADAGLVELFFNFGRYLTISSSAKGSRATNLQGIWNELFLPPWNSNYTTNINTEMNYWPTLMCNLSDFYEPLVSMIKDLSKTGSGTARDFYHADGFCVHHNTDLWAHSTAVGDRNVGSARWGFWNGAGGWLCAHLAEYYEYTEDLAFLKDTAYPLMKEAAKFYLDVLVEYEGRYIVTPATSPENFYMHEGERRSVVKWATMTQAIVYELFEKLVKFADVLGEDKEFSDKLSQIMPKLVPYTVADDGRMLEWDSDYEEFDKNHRHVSHLYGLYPGTSITTDSTPDLAEACKKSLEVRGDDGTGWSLGWKANLWAKLKDGDHALKIIKRQLEIVETGDGERSWQQGGTYPNMFDAHPPFQIDGNFGCAAAIAQLVLQSEDDMIKILPALPQEFENGSVCGLVAKGNVLVDIVWKDGKATSVKLTAKFDKDVKVKINDETKTVSLKKDTAFECIA